MQDRSVRIVSEYLDEGCIASMQWPARSQDLNPIENVQMSCPLLTAWVDGVTLSHFL
jgi:hypothetical protein